MIWIDWLIVVIPLTTLIALACYSNRYAGSVADFLVAGRIAGRYVLSVGDMTAGLSVIVLVAGCEQHYQTGYAVGFWGAITAPVGVFMAMTGFCMYRWRETRCLSLGQFLELRYGSRFFRMFCAALRTVAEMMSNAIGPAIAANFFIYFLGLPHKVMIWGVALPCYAIVDWFSRKVMAYNVVNTMDAFHCVDTLRMAVERFGKPEIFNSDQGSQFTSSEFVGELRNYGVKISMDGRGRCLDNAKMERFWWALKYEDIKIKEYLSLPQLRCGVQHYVNFYNTKRIHSALRYQTPNEVYFGTCNQQTKGYGNSKVFTPIFQ